LIVESVRCPSLAEGGHHESGQGVQRRPSALFAEVLLSQGVDRRRSSFSPWWGNGLLRNGRPPSQQHVLLAEDLVELVGGVALHLRCTVGVDIGGYSDAAVAEDGLDGLERDAEVEQQAGAAVAEVVEPNAGRQAGGAQQALEVALEMALNVGLLERRAFGRDEHQIHILPSGARGEAHFGLAPALFAQRSGHHLGQVQDAAGLSGFGFLKNQFAVAALAADAGERAFNGEGLLVEIDVGPGKRERFAEPKAAQQQGGIERAVFGVPAGVEQLFCLCGVERRGLAWPDAGRVDQSGDVAQDEAFAFGLLERALEG
jgi:hypothetical protein